jgi:uncharacterized protein YdeI (YjbR/CyaY-like superfamily)
MNPLVDAYISKAKNWQKEMTMLRKIVVDCGLTEELKWRIPCYMFLHNNVAMIGALKESCVFSFFKGALLKDDKGILEKPGENSQSVRVIKFTNVAEINKIAATLRAYIYEAIEVERGGLKVDFAKNTELVFVEELIKKLEENPTLKKAFFALTPGRQRAYNLYFSAPKQSKTREVRIEKYVQQILNGKGIKDCVCGLSRKLNYCDGSHKYLK